MLILIIPYTKINNTTGKNIDAGFAVFLKSNLFSQEQLIKAANQAVMNTNDPVPNKDSICLKTNGPYTNLLICTAPSKGPSNDDKKKIAVEITGKVRVERMLLF